VILRVADIDRTVGGESLTPKRERWLARVAERQYGVVSGRQLRMIGYSDDAIHYRVRCRRLYVVHRGVYAVGRPALSRNGERLAAVLAYGPGTVLSHQTAAAHWGLARPGRGIHVTLPTGRGKRGRPGIILHHTRSLPSQDTTTHDGIPVTSIPRTLLDLAGSQPKLLQGAIEEAENLRLLELEAMNELLGRANGHKGARYLRSLLTLSYKPIKDLRSELEREFIRFCRREGIPIPETNVVVEGITVDAHWPGTNLIVELDSWSFHRGREEFERDHQNSALLEMAGQEVFRITDRMLRRERERVRSRIVAAVG
jgi:very-short-patch-repair endonuclease